MRPVRVTVSFGPGASTNVGWLRALRDAGRVRSPLAADDLAFLQKYGVLRAEVALEGEHLVFEGKHCGINLLDDACFDCVCATMLGSWSA